MKPRPNRTRAETLAYLEQRRRLAAADIDMSHGRVDAIDRSLDALRSGMPIEACALEALPVEDQPGTAA